MPPKHPATYTASILERLGQLLAEEPQPLLVLDPFAGAGNLGLLPFRYVGVEIEREWANSVQGDARRLPFADGTFGAVATSPTYGNRMADHHNAKDGRHRVSYKHYLGRQLTAGNSGQMHWGEEYRELHRLAWAEAHRVLKPGAACLVNVKDFIRGGERVRVTDWHAEALDAAGFEVEATDEIPVFGMGYGAHRELRVPYEVIIRCRKNRKVT